MRGGEQFRQGGDRKWQEIRRKKTGVFAGSTKGRGRKKDPRETTFFVANLPKGTLAKDLEHYFGPYGRITDTYVAVKRDKAGSLFGFVIFSYVIGKWDLERSMSMITINNAKLSVNLAKFDRGGNPCGRDKGKNPHQNHAAIEVKVHDNADFDAVQWLQVEEEEWCPGWLSKPEKTHDVNLNLGSPGEEDHESPEQNEVEQPNLVEGHRSRVHGNVSKYVGGSMKEVMVALPPRRKARLKSGEPTRVSPLHDLNLQVLSSHQADVEIPSRSGSSQSSGNQAAEGVGIRNENCCLEKEEETIKMGKDLGVNLENMEDFVVSVIEREMESNMVQ
ncbi:hypothetical protein L1987_78500 [Smallanthus sonchifolius]|uniref:Uncharacterized protein n=1 Tax=Smallanthus sonchifolius TaxID=185202 RepID=A0ACB8ZD05_9ASTR|nr:hypothetical protein L1987_78500 [Smallanthus sonchifolius]